jgi:hypothetical protein
LPQKKQDRGALSGENLAEEKRALVENVELLSRKKLPICFFFTNFAGQIKKNKNQ